MLRIPVKRPKAIRRMREAGRIVAESFDILANHIKPGVKLSHPGVICASINHEICHGLPDGRILQEGDIVGIDIGLKFRGYCGDACVTFGVGQISAEAQRLLDIAQECLRVGIQAARYGNRLNDIGMDIENYADTQQVTVVKEWGGHGLGKSLHEAPSVSHVRSPDRGPKLRPGMTFTIEPMINAGGQEWILLEDGWTVITKDGSLSAQFEHSIAITENGPEILTKL